MHVHTAGNENLYTQAGYIVTGAVSIAAVNDAAITFVPLEIHSSLTDFAAGNVGIGTATIRNGATLDVNGMINVSSLGAASSTTPKTRHSASKKSKRCVR